METIHKFLMQLESKTAGLKPKELLELGYMWPAEDELAADGINIITGPESFE